jgi:hypothetical protein
MSTHHRPNRQTCLHIRDLTERHVYTSETQQTGVPLQVYIRFNFSIIYFQVPLYFHFRFSTKRIKQQMFSIHANDWIIFTRQCDKRIVFLCSSDCKRGRNWVRVYKSLAFLSSTETLSRFHYMFYQPSIISINKLMFEVPLRTSVRLPVTIRWISLLHVLHAYASYRISVVIWDEWDQSSWYNHQKELGAQTKPNPVSFFIWKYQE